MKHKILLLIPALFITLTSCGKRDGYVTIDGFAQGTTYHFVLQASDTTGLQRSIDSVFSAVDNSMSVYNPTSLINKVNANETDSVDAYIAACIEIARRISEISDGAYDITIKPITQAIGYAGKEAEESPDIDSLLQYVGYDKIKVRDGRLAKADPAMQIDLNSVAKGYTSDLMGEMFEKRGVTNYMVEIGGEIFCRGDNPRGKAWVVGIDRPIDGNMIPGNDLQTRLSISGVGLATSGNYRKYYIDDNGRKVTHIVNARTGKSGYSDILSATVIAESCAEADAAATMLTIIGLERAKEILASRPDWMAYLVFDDGNGGFATYVTDNFSKLMADNRQ